MFPRLKKMLRRQEAWCVAVCSLVWFAVLTPWGRFPDPDAFYHAHMATLLLRMGPLHAFPWLDLTTFGRHVVDEHFLYHLLLIPAVAWAHPFGFAQGGLVRPYDPLTEFWATQWMALVFATMAAMVLWMMVRQLDRSRAWIWTMLALLIPGFSFRLLLGKASPLAIAFFLIVTTAMVLRRPVWAAIAGFLFALVHGGWMICIVVAIAMLIGDACFSRWNEKKSWSAAISQAPWKIVLGLLIGTTVGLVLHPNHGELFHFLWVQVVSVGMNAGDTVALGTEWSPASPFNILGDLAPLVIAGLAAGIALLNQRRPADVAHKRTATLLVIPLVMTLAFTLKSQRFIEYLAPTTALWIASLWMLVDMDSFKKILRELLSAWPRNIQKTAIAFLMILGASLITHHAYATWSGLRRAGDEPFNAYRETIAAISAKAVSGDRVFASWDDFPLLFAADDRLREVSGLDPTFLAHENPQLSQSVEDLIAGKEGRSAWDVIVNDTHSRFVFISTQQKPLFDAVLRKDSRFHEIARDSTSAAYEMLKP